MLKAIREERGLSQAQLAEAAEIHVRALQAYEQGWREIEGAKFETLLKLAVALDCNIESILSDKNLRQKFKSYQQKRGVKMDYYIYYGTGAGDETFSGTLDEAKAAADEAAAYTQKDIVIYDKDVFEEDGTHGEYVSRRRWWGVEYDPEVAEDENPIRFGSFGYYGDWADRD